MANKITLEGSEVDALFIGATRYCLGRRSVAVSEICAILKRHWPSMPENVKRIIERDIREAIVDDDEDRAEGREFKRLGDDCDRAEWDVVARLFKQRISTF